MSFQDPVVDTLTGVCDVENDVCWVAQESSRPRTFVFKGLGATPVKVQATARLMRQSGSLQKSSEVT